MIVRACCDSAALTVTQTFSLTIGGVAQHLISYYKVEDVEQGRLRSPSTLPELASLDISPEYLDKTHFRNPPKVEIGVDGIPRYRGEADDVETSPSLLTTPLSLPPYEEPSSSKRSAAKRYDPYGAPATSPTTAKRSRKSKTALNSRSQDAADEATSPTTTTYGPPATSSQPTGGYPETSLSATTNMVPYGYYPYPVTPGYPPAPYVPPPPPAATSSSPVIPPQQTPTPPQQTTPVIYAGYTSSSEAQTASQGQTLPPPVPYPSYYVPPHPPHTYGSYPNMWTHYPGFAGGQSAERVQKEERDEQTET